MSSASKTPPRRRANVPGAGTRSDPTLADRPVASITPAVRSVAITGLFVIALGFTLHAAASLLIPIAVATLLSLLLSPWVRLLARWRIPPTLSAGVIVGGILAAVLSAFTMLSEPARNWLGEAPASLDQLRHKLERTESPLTDIEAVARQVDDLTAIDSASKEASPVEIRSPGLYQKLLEELPTLLASVGVTVFLTFFLLAAGQSLLRKVTRLGTTFDARRRIVTVAHRIQADISRYLGTVTLINIALGSCTAGLMHLLEVPNPLLWGVMVGILNFAPYLGAATSTVVLLLVGATTFDTLSEALAVPAVFLTLTIMEGQLITPAVIGRRLALSPTVVFVSVLAWGWLWGVAGALIAVPIVASMKVICEYVPALHPVADLLDA